ncbi:hypothetical protein AMAG_17957 [Allomyces macrogynus ATCC 38327]|uniref:F-box domain-containing protein n=1 Tax=Allomyces macrogynus (strain ATCC 38327) TaxID=578462 RepID=A0A0L0S2B3_ALLM3|nr:hypothetical protein AMAG_17957 [Allomyces macrogynus ATCC 38327]|eukprot:KNE56727.1 hypothetical protein AMAG_17957 [Allomyces macrogynus ATCC 38327]
MTASAPRLLQADTVKFANLEMVAHQFGTAALLLASIYSWPYTICKGITYLHAIRRRRTLLTLPPEVLHCIMDHLHAEDIVKLAATRQQLCLLVDSDLVWASLIFLMTADPRATDPTDSAVGVGLCSCVIRLAQPVVFIIVPVTVALAITFLLSVPVPVPVAHKLFIAMLVKFLLAGQLATHILHAAKLATVAHHLGTLALLLASVYSWPHTLCKSVTYLRALQRRRFPLQPWPRILCTLIALPAEILCRVTDHLHAEDLAQLAATCRRFRALVDSNAVWASLVQRDFATRATRVFPASITRRKPSAKYQYRVLADSAAVVGPCACARDAPRASACCYTAFAYEKRTAAPWYRRWRVTWREIHGGWPAVLATIRAHARTHLYQVLLTPAKLAGVVLAAPLLFIAWLRLRRMTAHGVWGHLARDLYLSSWAILTDAAVALDAHWLLVTAPMCVLALALRDADRVFGWMWRYRHALVQSAVRIVVVVGALGSAASVLAMGAQLLAMHGKMPVSGPWARVMVKAVPPVQV